MKRLYQRRNARLHEKLLFDPLAQVIAGLILVAYLPAALTWGWQFWLDPFNATTATNTLLATGGAFLGSLVALHHLRHYPGTQVVAYILPTTSLLFLAAGAWLLLTRLPYSRPVLLAAWVLSMLWFLTDYLLSVRYHRLHFAVVPQGEARHMTSSWRLTVTRIEAPELGDGTYDGVVADLASDELSPVWEKFLARCTLQRIPVYHIKQIEESLTGRVRIRHMAENEFGSLMPSPLYQLIKRLIDIVGVVITLPLSLPLMALTALAIRLDSPGPALFVQPRVGEGDKNFSIYKFRSMRIDAERDGAKLAATNDDRITRVGRFIRKTRLDELPQFFNVLKGDMSLIGPRPEQRAFVSQFEEEIPFYSYRHVVKPGITGWAQVMQGYASDTDDTRIKLQYDLYYIKHFSIWLDVLIVMKTIRTIITGHGAK